MCLRTFGVVLAMRGVGCPVFFSLLFFVNDIRDNCTRRASASGASFAPPFSFPVAFSNGFNRVHTGRFRNKLSFGANKAVNGPMHTLTSKCVSHVHIARNSNCILSITCSGNCSAVGHRLDTFINSITHQIRSLRCRGRD